MPPPNVSLPVRPSESAAATSNAKIATADDGATATSSSNTLAEPMDAFNEKTLADFEEELTNSKGRLALTANERAQLCMILAPDWEVSPVDTLGHDKTKKEIKRENTKK